MHRGNLRENFPAIYDSKIQHKQSRNPSVPKMLKVIVNRKSYQILVASDELFHFPGIMISTTIVRYRFYLSSQKFSKSTWPALSLNSYVLTTYYTSCNEPLGQDTLLKQH